MTQKIYENDIEAELQEKGLNAPRLSHTDIGADIVGETFTMLPSGKVMVCELMLRNGCSVRGEASVIRNEKFNEQTGRNISRKRAYDKVRQLEVYLLQQRCYESSNK